MQVSLPGCTNSNHFDLLVAGAGPAGLACAIAASMRGLRVHVVDGRKPPIDKACGEGLMPDTLASLTRLGIECERIEAVGLPLRGINFVRDGHVVEGAFPEGYGLGIRRTHLHQLLHERALELGVTFSWQTTVTGVVDGELQTNHGTMRARWIAGADGPQSRIRRMVGLETQSKGRRRIALRQHFSVAPWTDMVEVHWTGHAQAYVTPIACDEVCIVFIGSSRFQSLQQAISLFPALHQRLGMAALSGSSLGAATRNRRLRRVTAGNIALIGDASGSVDAITGEGLALCFRQADALADALIAGDLSRYERRHRQLSRLPLFMARSMLLMDRHPLALSTTFRAFKRRAELFPRMLEVHVGYRPMRLLGSGGLLATLVAMLIP